MIEAVIFNLDGVLVCSDECHYRAWTQLAHEQGCCVIVVTHDPEVADLADKVYRVKDGVLALER